MLLAVLVAATFGSDAEILAADHSVWPSHLQKTWQARRAFADRGVWDQTAVILHIKTVIPADGKHFASGNIYTYTPNTAGDMHTLDRSIEVTGVVRSRGGGERKRLTIVWHNSQDEAVAALTFVRGKKVAAKHRRVLLRLYASYAPSNLAKTTPYLTDGPCDAPPDDDVLEPANDPLGPSDPPPEDLGP